MIAFLRTLMKLIGTTFNEEEDDEKEFLLERGVDLVSNKEQINEQDYLERLVQEL